MLPQKFEPIFNKLGINIHDPKYLKPMELHKHRKNAYAYNKEWEIFLEKPGLTQKDILNFSKTLEQKYNIK